MSDTGRPDAPIPEDPEDDPPPREPRDRGYATFHESGEAIEEFIGDDPNPRADPGSPSDEHDTEQDEPDERP